MVQRAHAGVVDQDIKVTEVLVNAFDRRIDIGLGSRHAGTAA
jgi:hypothetical protein